MKGESPKVPWQEGRKARFLNLRHLTLRARAGYSRIESEFESLLLKQFPPEGTREFYIDLRIRTVINHPHLFRMVDHRNAPQEHYILLEGGFGGTVTEALGRQFFAQIEEVFCLAIQMASVLHYLHEQCIVHGAVCGGAIVLHRRTGPVRWQLGDLPHAQPLGASADYPSEEDPPTDPSEDLAGLGKLLLDCMAQLGPGRTGSGSSAATDLRRFVQQLAEAPGQEGLTAGEAITVLHGLRSRHMAGEDGSSSRW